MRKSLLFQTISQLCLCCKHKAPRATAYFCEFSPKGQIIAAVRMGSILWTAAASRGKLKEMICCENR